MALTKAKAAVAEEELKYIVVRRDPKNQGQLDGEVHVTDRQGAKWDMPAGAKSVIGSLWPSVRVAVGAARAGLNLSGPVESDDIDELWFEVREVLDQDRRRLTPRVFQIASQARIRLHFRNEAVDGDPVTERASALWALTPEEQTTLAPLIQQAKNALNA